MGHIHSLTPPLFFVSLCVKFCLTISDPRTVCISFVLIIAVYIIYWKGPVLRKRSPFAQQLSDARAEQDHLGRRLSRLTTSARANSFARSQQDFRVRQALGSRQNSYAASMHRKTPVASRRNSAAIAKANAGAAGSRKNSNARSEL